VRSTDICDPSANNYLKHTDVEQLAKKLAACGTTDKTCKDTVVIEAKKISDKNDAELLACGTDQSCVQKNIGDWVKGSQSFGLNRPGAIQCSQTRL